jgi:DNA-directed RNA polymerase specialized sigma24 family protein
VVRDPDTSIGGDARRFPTTRDSLVAEASHPHEATRRAAFGDLSAVYWKPVYRYIRLKWHKDNEDAKDLTQAFLVDLFVDSTLADFDPGRASFQTYMRLCIDGFVGHAQESAGRLKRGGGYTRVLLDLETVGGDLPDDRPAPFEEFFHREWQRQMFALGVDDLGALARASGKHLPFRVFEAHDLVDEPPSYAELADRFGVAVSTITNYLAWARRELRRLVLVRAKATTVTPAQYSREVRALFGRRG